MISFLWSVCLQGASAFLPQVEKIGSYDGPDFERATSILRAVQALDGDGSSFVAVKGYTATRIIRLTADGTPHWTNIVSVPGYSDHTPLRMQVDSQGAVVVLIVSQKDGLPSQVAHLVKYDWTGARKWSAFLGYSADVESTPVAGFEINAEDAIWAWAGSKTSNHTVYQFQPDGHPHVTFEVTRVAGAGFHFAKTSDGGALCATLRHREDVGGLERIIERYDREGRTLWIHAEPLPVGYFVPQPWVKQASSGRILAGWSFLRRPSEIMTLSSEGELIWSQSLTSNGPDTSQVEQLAETSDGRVCVLERVQVFGGFGKRFYQFSSKGDFIRSQDVGGIGEPEWKLRDYLVEMNDRGEFVVTSSLWRPVSLSIDQRQIRVHHYTSAGVPVGSVQSLDLGEGPWVTLHASLRSPTEDLFLLWSEFGFSSTAVWNVSRVTSDAGPAWIRTGIALEESNESPVASLPGKDGQVYALLNAVGRSGNQAVQLLEIRADGQPGWVREFGGDELGGTWAEGIALTASGDITAIGVTRRSWEKMPNAVLVVQYSAAGDLRWSKRVEFMGTQLFTSSPTTSDLLGNSFVTGRYYDEAGFRYRLFALGFSSRGQSLWENPFLADGEWNVSSWASMEPEGGFLLTACNSRPGSRLNLRLNGNGSILSSNLFPLPSWVGGCHPFLPLGEGRGVISGGMSLDPRRSELQAAILYVNDVGQILMTNRWDYVSSTDSTVVVQPSMQRPGEVYALYYMERSDKGQLIRYGVDGSVAWSNNIEMFNPGSPFPFARKEVGLRLNSLDEAYVYESFLSQFPASSGRVQVSKFSEKGEQLWRTEINGVGNLSLAALNPQRNDSSSCVLLFTEQSPGNSKDLGIWRIQDRTVDFAAPTIEGATMTDVGLNGGDLIVRLNPRNGLTDARYQVQLYGSSPVVLEGGWLGAHSSEPLELRSRLEGLLPHTTYQVSVLATNLAGASPEYSMLFTTSNTLPVARRDIVRVLQGEDATLNVCDNDTDADGDILEVSRIASVEGGQVLYFGRSIAFRADARFNGMARLTYFCKDAFAESSDPAEVSIEVVKKSLPQMNELSIFSHAMGGVMVLYQGFPLAQYGLETSPAPEGPWKWDGTSTSDLTGIVTFTFVTGGSQSARYFRVVSQPPW